MDKINKKVKYFNGKSQIDVNLLAVFSDGTSLIEYSFECQHCWSDVELVKTEHLRIDLIDENIQYEQETA